LLPSGREPNAHLPNPETSIDVFAGYIQHQSRLERLINSSFSDKVSNHDEQTVSSLLNLYSYSITAKNVPLIYFVVCPGS
jgi:hypothetical protein